MAYTCQRVGEAPTSRATREDFFDDQTPPSACSIRSGTSRSCLWRGVFQRRTDSVMPIDFFSFSLVKYKSFLPFIFCIQFGSYFFYCYFFFIFCRFFFSISSLIIWFHLIFISNLILILLIAIYFFFYHFLYWILFSISSLNIWFWYIF
jgi:hypothetical protein